MNDFATDWARRPWFIFWRREPWMRYRLELESDLTGGTYRGRREYTWWPFPGFAPEEL